jgi:hypothetical protein
MIPWLPHYRAAVKKPNKIMGLVKRSPSGVGFRSPSLTLAARLAQLRCWRRSGCTESVRVLRFGVMVLTEPVRELFDGEGQSPFYLLTKPDIFPNDRLVSGDSR